MNPMVIRLLSVPDCMKLPEFDAMRAVLGWHGDLGYIVRVHAQREWLRIPTCPVAYASVASVVMLCCKHEPAQNEACRTVSKGDIFLPSSSCCVFAGT